MNDSNRFRSISFWSWNGEMKKDEIILQIEEMNAQGFVGFIIHARAGLKIRYMGDEWISAIGYAIETAKRLKMHIWFYDEDGWPSGFAGGTVLDQSKDFHQQFLAWEETDFRNVEEKTIIAAYKKTEVGYKRLNDTEIKNQELVFYLETNPQYSNLLNPDAVKCFIENTHEVYYKYFGHEFNKTIKGIFTDEPQVSVKGIPWTKEIQTIFREQNEYDLIEYLPHLVFDIHGYQKVRHDFWKLVNQLFVNSYSQQIYDWCTGHQIFSTGHLPSEDGLCDQVISSGGVMPHYEYMHVPGIDHLGRRLTSPVLSKQVASVARQLGKEEVLSETFGCSGWNASFAELARIWDWQALMGINTPCLHLSAYSLKGCRKRDYPPVFSYQEPWWENFHLFNNYLRGLNQTLSEGEHEVEILVLHPMSGIWCEAQQPYSPKMKTISNEFRELSENLISMQCDFEYGDEQIIEKYGRIEGDLFFIKERAYRFVLVAQTENIENKTFELLKEYCENGGRVLFINSVPERIDGSLSDRVKGLVDNGNAKLTVNRARFIQTYLKHVDHVRTVEVLHRYHDEPVSNIFLHIRNNENGKIIFFFHKDITLDCPVRLVMEGNVGIAAINPENLERTSLSVYTQGEKTYCNLQIQQGQSFLIEATEKKSLENISVEYTEYIENISGSWKVKIHELNSMTLDYARYCIDEGNWSEKMPIIYIQAEVYDKIHEAKKECKTYIQYEFFTAFENIPEEMYLVVEKEEELEIFVNGCRVNTDKSDWWLDRNFMKFSISDFLRNGQNYIELRYNIKYWQPSFNLEDMFESERNRFFYPVEIENVYILGDMDVEALGKVVMDAQNYITVEPEGFVLKDYTIKESYGDITSQNLWFYRGNASLEKDIEINKVEEFDCVYLCVPESRCVMFNVYINETLLGSLLVPPYKIDVTKHVKNGINRIRIELIGSNRNLLGPHHHFKGENYFTGPSTFKGVKGWEDFINIESKEVTWDDNYNFVKFGFISEPKLIYKSLRQ